MASRVRRRWGWVASIIFTALVAVTSVAWTELAAPAGSGRSTAPSFRTTGPSLDLSRGATAVGAAPAHVASQPLASGGNRTWTNLTGIASSLPGNRYLGAMTFDALDNYILLFGGATPTSTLSDTLTYANGTWTDISGNQNSTPGARYAAFITYDPADQEVVMFGGYDLSTGTYYSDTWLFAHGLWHQLTYNSTATHPSGRWRGGFAYDAHDGYAVLFGGTDSTGAALSDTWEFHNNSWTKLSPSGSPPGRYRTSMAYDAGDGYVVMFGGCTSSCPASDTWRYVNDSWKSLSLTTHPSGRVYPMIVSDPVDNGLLLFGGGVTSGVGPYMSDTWTFASGNWTNETTLLSPSSHPPTRAYGMVAYDPYGGYVLLFAGANSSTAYDDDLWAYGPDILAWGSATPNPVDSHQSTTFATTILDSVTGISYVFAYTGLPPGCTTSNLRNLSCHPTTPGNYSITVGIADGKGNDANVSEPLRVATDPVILTFTVTPSVVTAGVPILFNVTARNGTGNLSYHYVGLPAGCSSGNTPHLTCTPSSNTSKPVEVQVSDAAGYVVESNVSLTVNPRPSVTSFTASPPITDAGLPVTITTSVSGGTAPFHYVYTGLPPGCASQNSAVLMCVPQGFGPATVTVVVTDAYSFSANHSLSLLIHHDPVVSSFSVSANPTEVGVNTSFVANLTYGTAPFAYAYAGSPSGCLLQNSSTPYCSPGAAGNFTVALTVTDAAGGSTTGNVSFTVVARPTVSSFLATPEAIDLGQSTTLTVGVTGGYGPFGYTFTGLPTGCAPASQPSLTCTPIAAGRSPITVTVLDHFHVTATGELNLTVNPTLAVGPASSNSPVNTQALLTISVTVQGGTTPYRFAYAGLPTGCSSANSNSISCNPSTTGTFNVVVTVTDATNATGHATVSVSVQSSSGGSPLSGGLTLYVILGVVAAVVIGAAVLLMRRRGRGPSDGSAARGRASSSSETAEWSEPNP